MLNFWTLFQHCLQSSALSSKVNGVLQNDSSLTPVITLQRSGLNANVIKSISKGHDGHSTLVYFSGSAGKYFYYAIAK